jgi:hypothetical protein
MQSESVERHKPILNPTVVYGFYAKDDAELEKVDKWLATSCQGPWFFHFGYIFEEANDAVAFKLAFGGMMMEKHLDDDEYPCP